MYLCPVDITSHIKIMALDLSSIQDILEPEKLKLYEKELVIQLEAIQKRLSKVRRVIRLLEEDEDNSKPAAPVEVEQEYNNGEDSITLELGQVTGLSFPNIVLEFLRKVNRPMSLNGIMDFIMRDHNPDNRPKHELSGIVSPALNYYIKKGLVKRVDRGVYQIEKGEG